ncbi:MULTISPECIES: ABC transporter ATP-binding protein [unclassified Clostridium]|uniref:ABC transporter ATP-binding protein n=1 Tax=unclassified Clostridium TaxID=2614128 RepID=UPI0002979F35|nr:MULTISPECIES: ABC transporter ATP-binding protein [unclassified Clostridium]EKQ51629.1 MAG: ABC-type multidrug transport system, ATPase and permease component [Clostridium sp. Maddingley MBC34-26]
MTSTSLNSMKKTMNLEMKPPKTIKRLLKLMLPYKKGIFLAFSCVILVNIAALIKPYILKLVIDDFLTKHIVQNGFYSITTMGIIYFLVVLISSVLSISQVFLINKVGQEIMRNLRSKVFRTIQLLPLSYLDKTSSGRLITRATNDVEALSEMYTDVVINLFKDVILIVGIVYTMIIINLKLALVSFCVVPLMFGVVFVIKTKIKRNFAKMKSLIGKINGFMAENISGMRIVQIFHGEKEKREEFLKLNNGYYKATLFQVWMNSFLKPAADVFQSFAVAILIWYGMGKISDNTLSIGVLYAFTNYIKQFFDPISDMADNYTTIQSALVSADRIFELLDEEESIENLDLGIGADRFQGNIEFRNVWFSYNDKDWVLKDVSFVIKRGQTAAFVGQTGSGKTTIISLISGFYNVQKGEILIDGININEIKKRDLRKNIAVVLQDVFLFSGTIENNITLNDKIEENKVKKALEISHGKEIINNFENGINEFVMERGSTLSLGQRQLISFARAIAHDPSIFVLDEATANIDTATEILIQKAIESITKEKTTIIIAHRLSTIRNADVIIVLRNGEIIESGNHDSLMESGGYYKELITRNNNERG